jgi:hypothetical protein
MGGIGESGEGLCAAWLAGSWLGTGDDGCLTQYPRAEYVL